MGEPQLTFRPIFPHATRDDLLDELALTDLAIERMGIFPIVNVEQRDARIRRLGWWRERIVSQLAEMTAETGDARAGFALGIALALAIWGIVLAVLYGLGVL